MTCIEGQALSHRDTDIALDLQSILIKRARDGAVEGPYYRYTVDANNCQVGSTVKGGPRIFLDAIKELSDDGEFCLHHDCWREEEVLCHTCRPVTDLVDYPQALATRT